MKKMLLTVFLLSFAIVGCTDQTTVDTDENGNDELNKVDANDEDLLSPNTVLNIAHRGASGHAPEHTIPSYETAEEMVGDYIEIDLQMTNDGELIAMHDADVSRTTNEEGLVHNFSLDEIKAFDAGTWFNEKNPERAQPVFSNVSIPTLEEIIERFGPDSNYYIETKTPEKYPGMIEELISLLEKQQFIGPNARKGKVIIQSFSEDGLQEVSQLDPSIPLIQLISYNDTASITNDQMEEIKDYAIGIGANYEHLTEEYVAKVRDAGLLLHAYTVNEEDDMKQLIEWGVTGIFTDYPDRLSGVLDGV
ncbi:glycerophosphoryl diester phosphodiesterase [Virgibacillus natechei]|uniref:Glycerophosphoryl diester phosphodiesterase n=1 Tax=Virgibacillus natechei TaxID=1216297 RepID=A0ABS4IH89_9BACI|nr:glycerophosphodiester phosphodiesterase [Virgibacillus natechei]MBP1969369.1 glycerophosphoryl diester phosphodiesterase [Virgibacillus natechei]UZD12514.1 glycerophosphodiester phosphodiesterase [Virgibacillus natechei]